MSSGLNIRYPVYLICLLFIGVGLSGCKVVKRPDYPIGIYSVGNANNLPDIAAVGFNLVTGPAEIDYLDAAESNDLMVLASPGSVAGEAFNVAKIRATIARFDRHPALWSWYLIDEPDMKLIDPDRVQEAHSALKRAGATKPTSLVLYKGDEAQWYGGIAD
ncbi:MAG: hypothetical protein VYB35_06760, partial [Verrucomicrobiota bacterium]|nr:hypothetical protein [Verrucomicrobiota bacterium]